MKLQAPSSKLRGSSFYSGRTALLRRSICSRRSGSFALPKFNLFWSGALKCGVWCFSGAWSMVLGILTVALITTIRLYQIIVSPVLSVIFGPTAGCRFTPTCSCYAREAVQTHGAIRGSWLALKRVCRCHPWGDCGEDHVPHPLPSISKRSAA